MKYYILFLIFFSFKSLVACEREPTVDMIRSFLEAVSNNTYDTDQIVEKYICYSPPDHEKKSKEAYELLKMQVEALGTLVENHSIESLDIIPYQDLPKEEQDIITDDNSLANIYVVKTGKDRLMSIFIKNKKIGSFVTLRKGNHRIFALFC